MCCVLLCCGCVGAAYERCVPVIIKDLFDLFLTIATIVLGLVLFRIRLSNRYSIVIHGFATAVQLTAYNCCTFGFYFSIRFICSCCHWNGFLFLVGLWMQTATLSINQQKNDMMCEWVRERERGEGAGESESRLFSKSKRRAATGGVVIFPAHVSF